MNSYKYFKELSKTDLDALNRKELTDFVEKCKTSLSGGNYEKVKYKNVTITQEWEEYKGSDIDGYTLPSYYMDPCPSDLYERAKLLKGACEEKYKKLAAEPISREEYDKILERWEKEE